jgi:predicted dehydrogenase
MQRSSPIRVGIIGLGAIGKRLLHAFLKHPETEIVAVYDVVKGRAQLI